MRRIHEVLLAIALFCGVMTPLASYAAILFLYPGALALFGAFICGIIHVRSQKIAGKLDTRSRVTYAVSALGIAVLIAAPITAFAFPGILFWPLNVLMTAAVELALCLGPLALVTPRLRAWAVAFAPAALSFVVYVVYPRSLIGAVKEGPGFYVELLLAAGQDIDQQNDDGWTPLFAAVANHNLAMVETLLAHGAQPDLKDNAPLTPLEQAAMNGDVEIMERLVRGGAKLDKSNTLLWAVLGENTNAVDWVVANDPHACTREQAKNIVDKAQERRNSTIIERVVSACQVHLPPP